MESDRRMLAGINHKIGCMGLALALLGGCTSTGVTPPQDMMPSADMPPPPPPPPPPPNAEAEAQTDGQIALAYNAPPAEMMVLRGSANAIALYPKGRIVSVNGRICLPSYVRFLTFQRRAGGLVTYGGGGCNKRIEEPSNAETANAAGVWSGP